MNLRLDSWKSWGFPGIIQRNPWYSQLHLVRVLRSTVMDTYDVQASIAVTLILRGARDLHSLSKTSM